MLKKLRIENFKCWQDTGEIRLAPLTLLFGTNSSGKSSIGQFLMMLKYTASEGDRNSAFYLGSGSKDSALQLGAFKDIIRHHDVQSRISFSYDWDLPEQLEFKDSHTASVFKYDEIEFCAQIAFKERNAIPYVECLEYDLLNGGGQTVDVSLCRSPKGNYKLTSERYKFVRNPGRVWDITTALRFYGFPDEANTYYQNAQFVQALNYQQEALFKRVDYLGPMRSRPERIYSWSGNEPEGVGDAGQFAIPAMLAAAERRLSFKHRGRWKRFQEVIATSLKKLGLIDGFRVDPLSKDSLREFEVKVKTRNSKDWVNLPDVGFGISQVLPVLVACFYAPPGSILLIEEPEIHLHPSAQAALADVLIDVLNAREEGKPRNVQLIVETHSEHLLRRLQRRIAEEAISNEQVRSYFVDMTCNPAQLKELDVDIFGNILNWPKDFFGNTMDDVICQTQTAIRRSNSASST